MYIVKLDNQTLYDPRINLVIGNPKLELEVNKPGVFKFDIYPSHSLYDNINKLKSVIEVYQDDILLFRGRPLSDELDFYNTKQVYCEGDLAFFNDSIQRPYSFSGTVTEYLILLITNHNEQVETAKQFTLGNVTVTDANDYIVRGDNSYPSTMEVIKKKLLDLLGGYIVVRKSGGVNYIDYLADSTSFSTQTIKLGENILDVAQAREGQDIYTAIIPLGATLQDEGGIDYRVDITSVNDGVDYIYDVDAVAQYGYIFRMVEWKDVTLPSNLLTKAQAQLNEAINTLSSIDIKAIDLNMVDASIDDFRIFEYVTVESPIHQLNDDYLIKKLSIDLNNPKNNTLTIGKTYSTFTEKQFNSDTVIKEVVSDYVKNETIEDVRSEIETVSSEISQTAQEIRLQVEETYTKITDFETYKTVVESEFTQTANSIDIAITEVNQAIETAKDNITKVTTTTGYKFDADGLQITKTGEELSSLINNEGLYVTKDKGLISEVEMLKADSTGVNAENITVRKYLVMGTNSRMEDFEDELGPGTGLFFIGG